MICLVYSNERDPSAKEKRSQSLMEEENIVVKFIYFSGILMVNKYREGNMNKNLKVGLKVSEIAELEPMGVSKLMYILCGCFHPKTLKLQTEMIEATAYTREITIANIYHTGLHTRTQYSTQAS